MKTRALFILIGTTILFSACGAMTPGAFQAGQGNGASSAQTGIKADDSADASATGVSSGSSDVGGTTGIRGSGSYGASPTGGGSSGSADASSATYSDSGSDSGSSAPPPATGSSKDASGSPIIDPAAKSGDLVAAVGDPKSAKPAAETAGGCEDPGAYTEEYQLLFGDDHALVSQAQDDPTPREQFAGDDFSETFLVKANVPSTCYTPDGKPESCSKWTSKLFGYIRIVTEPAKGNPQYMDVHLEGLQYDLTPSPPRAPGAPKGPHVETFSFVVNPIPVQLGDVIKFYYFGNPGMGMSRNKICYPGAPPNPNLPPKDAAPKDISMKEYTPEIKANFDKLLRDGKTSDLGTDLYAGRVAQLIGVFQITLPEVAIQKVPSHVTDSLKAAAKPDGLKDADKAAPKK